MIHGTAYGFALFLLLTAPSEPKWLDDYGAALRQAELEGRPLLVVIEQTKTDEQGVRPAAIVQDRLRGGGLSAALADYKLCRVDASTPYGQEVARAFKATTLPHAAIIDNTASVQLFKKSGPMSASEWTTTLAAYRSGERSILQTRYRPTICFT